MTIALEPATGLPRGAMVCLACGVSWAVEAGACWCCGQPGKTTAEAAADLDQAGR